MSTYPANIAPLTENEAKLYLRRLLATIPLLPAADVAILRSVLDGTVTGVATPN